MYRIVVEGREGWFSRGVVVILGLVMPFLLFLAFSMGKNMQITTLLRGLLGMTVFFTATSVELATVTWETRVKTLEVLVPAPIVQSSIEFRVTHGQSGTCNTKM